MGRRAQVREQRHVGWRVLLGRVAHPVARCARLALVRRQKTVAPPRCALVFFFFAPRTPGAKAKPRPGGGAQPRRAGGRMSRDQRNTQAQDTTAPSTQARFK